jgi:serpin B
MNTRVYSYRILVRLVIVSLALTTAGLAGCATPGLVGDTVQANVAQSEKPRSPALAPELAQVPELVAGNTDFALDFYHRLFDREENLFYSPYSLSTALAMTYAGARGETERQMAEALHYTLPQAQLHPAFNALDQALASRSASQDERAVRLHFVNALWGQKGYTFLDTFLDTLAEHYGAGLRLVNFGQAEQALQAINRWVGEQTEHRIEELLPPKAVDKETVLVLTNAVYFQAAWLHPFAESATQDAPFTRLDGEQVTVPMMTQIASLDYAQHPGVQVVELPYAGSMPSGALSMVILLPEVATFEAFVQGLDARQMDALLSDLQPTGVRLALPRFRFAAEFQLADTLKDQGMVDAFGDADFSGMDGTHDLFIDQVYHQAFVAVDEAGTEATAATAVVMERKGGAPAEQEVRLDHPFLFLIRDVQTGAILFLGHVVDPTAQ